MIPHRKEKYGNFTVGFFAVFMFLAVTFSVFAQAPDTLWTQHFGDVSSEEARDVIQVADGGFVMTGYTRSYGAGSYDIWIVKADADGTFLWRKEYGGTSGESGRSIFLTGDGGYIIGGNTSSWGAGQTDLFLLKTNATGDTTGGVGWLQTYGGAFWDEGRTAVQTSDGGYALVGFVQPQRDGDYDVTLIKTDASGTVQWQQTYTGIQDEKGYDLIQTSDGGYALLGYTESYGAGAKDLYLIKTNATGDSVWAQTYGGPSDDEGKSLVQTSDGGYILTGYTMSFGSGAKDLYLVKVASDGTVEWTNTFGSTGDDEGYSVIQSSDGWYVAAGYSKPAGPGDDKDGFIVKVDGSGNEYWSKLSEKDDEDLFSSIKETSDNGYIAVGGCNISERLYDMYIVRLEADEDYIVGSVTDESSNALVGAVVRAWTDYPTGSLVDTTVTDAEGRFAIRLDAGTYDLRVQYPDYQIREVEDVVSPSADNNISLSPLPHISGTVEDLASSNPINNVKVVVWDTYGTGTRIDSTNTNASGEFSIAVNSDGNYDIAFTVTGYFDSVYVDVSAPGSGYHFDMRLIPYISGTVTDGSSPINSAKVVLWDTYNTGTRIDSTYTASDGTFTVDSLTEGNTYDLYVSKDGFYSKLTEDVSASSSGNNIALTILPYLRGSITSGGSAVAGATVQAWVDYPDSLVGETTTDASGNYDIAGLDSSRYDIRVFASGYYPTVNTDVLAPSAGNDMTLTEIPSVAPSRNYCDFWGDTSFYFGAALQIGDVITAEDPDGVTCGVTTVTDTTDDGFGIYLIHVYGEDDLLPEDQGAENGDTITFYINGYKASYIGDPGWANQESRHLELNVEPWLTCKMPIYPNWNLVSFHSAPDDSSVANIISGIDSLNYISAYYGNDPDPVKSWDRYRPASSNDLEYMNALHGYWMRSDTTVVETLRVAGQRVDVTTPINLYTGWNLIGYLPTTADSMSHAFNTLGTNYDYVTGMESSSSGSEIKTWARGRPVNDLYILDNHHGYWVHMGVDDILTYPESGYTAAQTVHLEKTSVKSSTKVPATPFWCDLWGVEPDKLSPGTEILVKDKDGVVCGSGIVRSGGAFLIHVYGDVPSTSVDEGAGDGDVLTLFTEEGYKLEPVNPISWQFRGNIQVLLSEKEESVIPVIYELEQNYPNPFNPETTIRYRIPEECIVTITVYNTMGQKIKTLVNKNLKAGTYKVKWDGRREDGTLVGSGMYIVKMKASGFVSARKVLFIQ